MVYRTKAPLIFMELSLKPCVKTFPTRWKMQQFGGILERIFYHGNVRLSQRTIYADTHIFSTMGIKVLAGNAEDLKTVENIFISRSLADKICEGAELSTVIGKQLYLDRKLPVTVRGVFEDLPENTDVPFQVVASMNHFWNNKRGGWGFDISYASLIRFKNPEQDIPMVEARVPK